MKIHWRSVAPDSWQIWLHWNGTNSGRIIGDCQRDNMGFYHTSLEPRGYELARVFRQSHQSMNAARRAVASRYM